MNKINERLEELTTEILINNDMYKFPVNVSKIAEKCGIEAYAGEMNKDISGVIQYKKDKNKFYAIINDGDCEERQRFSLAHELGHYFLHKDILLKDEYHIDVLYRTIITDDEETRQREKEADYFAGALLMNKLMLEKMKNDYTIKELAKMFVVSEAAMIVRLDILGLL